MPEENISSQQSVEPGRCHVVSHIGVADARRYPRRPRRGRKQAGLADAIGATERKHVARAIAARIGNVDIGIVQHTVAPRAIERDHPFELVLRSLANVTRELANGRSVAVDEVGGLQVCWFRRHRWIVSLSAAYFDLSCGITSRAIVAI